MVPATPRPAPYGLDSQAPPDARTCVGLAGRPSPAVADWSTPEPQRGFVWKATQVRGPAESLWYDYPIGSLLVWNSRGSAEEQHAHDARQPGLWVVDGQQRSTALSIVSGRKPYWWPSVDERNRSLGRFDIRFDLNATEPSRRAPRTRFFWTKLPPRRSGKFARPLTCWPGAGSAEPLPGCGVRRLSCSPRRPASRCCPQRALVAEVDGATSRCSAVTVQSRRLLRIGPGRIQRFEPVEAAQAASSQGLMPNTAPARVPPAPTRCFCVTGEEHVPEENAREE